MIRVGTVFSGIGAPEQAFIKFGIEHKLVFAGDIDKFCKKAYFANYDIDESRWHDDVTTFDATPYNGQIDLLIGGSPCQAFSIAGRMKGFEDTRGTLFFEYARVLKECQPKAFIFENVKNLIHHDKGNTFRIILETFKQLGYKTYHQVLNATDYGVPQNRQRLFVVGFKNDVESFEFPKAIPLTKTVQDLLEAEVEDKYILKDDFVNNYVLPEHQFNKNPQINRQIACTLCTHMGTYRASFDNYYTYKGKLRKLTPREGLRLMGFPDTFKIVCSNSQTYKQIGNSIVVDVIGGVIEEVIARL